MQKIMVSKIKTGRRFSFLIPFVVAIALSCGNDYIMMKSFRMAGSVDLDVLEQTIVFSNLSLIVGVGAAVIASNMIFRLILKQELLNPLQNLSDGMSHMAKGDFDYRIEYEENDPHFEIYDEFNEMAIETKRFAQKASSVDEGRKRLLLSIAHDLRSPLTSIIAYVQGLKDGIARTEEKRAQYLDIIIMKSLEIDKMVKQLFTFAKLDSDQMPLDLSEVSAAEFLQEYVQDKQEDLGDCNFKLSLQLVSDAKIRVDKALLRRVCDNLIENSIKYGDQAYGCMQIKVKAGKVNTKITFRDNGPGVAEDELVHLWDIFYRADTARKNPGQSNGIGLSIVKKAVEAMDGKVAAENAKEGGLQITIRLPIVEDEKEALE